MRIMAIGDIHGNLKKLRKLPLKGVDLILLTGDIGKADLARRFAFRNIERAKRGLPEIEETPQQDKAQYMQIYNSSISVLKYLTNFAPVFSIFGNVESHDYEIARREKKIGLKLPRFVKSIEKTGVAIINNKLRNFNGIRIGGLEYFIDVSWIKEYKPKNYRKRLKLAEKETGKTKGILRWFSRNDLDILVCHQPPYGILDQSNARYIPKHWRGKHAGSKVILDYIKKKQPRYVFCGHIHEGKGYKKIGKTEVYNLGVCGYKIIDF